jgi:hypothetical protein
MTGASFEAAKDLITLLDMSETGIDRNKKMTFAELKVAVGAYAPGGTDVAVADGGTGASTAAGARTNLGLANLGTALPLTFNFTDAGDAYFYADEAMTLTEQATTGAGSVSYEKGTTAAPDTFTSTSSPISLQAGAWLKVTADDAVAVHLKRTA